MFAVIWLPWFKDTYTDTGKEETCYGAKIKQLVKVFLS